MDRAIVVGIVNTPDDAEALVASGADALDISALTEDAVAALAVDVPLLRDLDDAATADTVAELSVFIARGARTVRTHDVRAARRVADVMAATLDARRPR